MGSIKTGELDMGYHGDGEEIPAKVWVQPASAEAVAFIQNADETSDHGRSPWVWVRFPNGDLMLATFPQGDTYFEHEEEREV